MGVTVKTLGAQQPLRIRSFDDDFNRANTSTVPTSAPGAGGAGNDWIYFNNSLAANTGRIRILSNVLRMDRPDAAAGKLECRSQLFAANSFLFSQFAVSFMEARYVGDNFASEVDSCDGGLLQLGFASMFSTSCRGYSFEILHTAGVATLRAGRLNDAGGGAVFGTTPATINDTLRMVTTVRSAETVIEFFINDVLFNQTSDTAAGRFGFGGFSGFSLRSAQPSGTRFLEFDSFRCGLGRGV